MKSSSVLLLLMICQSIQAQVWQADIFATLPAPVSNNAVCEGFSSEGAFLYSFGGIDSTLSHDGIHLRCWRVNSQSGNVESLPDLPDTLGKIAMAASRVGNIIYITGGYHVFPNGNEVSSNKMHRFDVTQNDFIADGAPIPIPIDDHVQAVYRDSLIYIVTGWSNTGNVPNVQIYNTFTNSWAEGSSVPNNNNYKCFGAAGEILGDTIYYFGGAAGSGFAAQTELRKGDIDPNDPTAINWQVSEPFPASSSYRAAACNTGEAVHWIGGSSVSYNYDAVAYNGSGVVSPSQSAFYLHPNTAEWGSENVELAAMDLRGVANISAHQKFLIGGIEESKTVSDKVIRLSYTGTLGVSEAVINSPFLTMDSNSRLLRSTHKGELRIFNLSGQILLSRIVQAKQTINLSMLPTGIYCAVLYRDQKLLSQKIVIP